MTGEEISLLEQNGNVAEDWGGVVVKEGFSPDCVRNCQFFGHVAIGVLEKGSLFDGALRLPEGIYQSSIEDSTIGDHCSLHAVGMLSHYHLGAHCLLFHIDEMTCDSNYVWLEPMNECGGRRILPFNGMRVGDAYLWARFRDRHKLLERLESMSLKALSEPWGGYGFLGDHCVIKNCRELHNVSVNSDAQAPSRIAGCVILSDGIVGFGCTVEDGCMARRFLLGENVHLEFGARLNDAVVGDNSTIARCEVGNSVIFPAHEQHHNNSFLIAALVMGQSNVAAGATIGSNHNGRTADNEIAAGRGFWPGLCASFKHSSRFASYCLLAKGDYPAELDIALPFALVSNNVSKNQLEVMPAYWWLYNMYALNRNEKKFAKRDKRVHRLQHIEFNPLAPDTAEEIVCGRELLRHWTEMAYLNSVGKDGKIEVLASNMEKGSRKVVVNKAAQGYAAYEDMLYYYAVKTLLEGRDEDDFSLPPDSLALPDREVVWHNIGGQLVAHHDLEKLIHDIEQGVLASWDDVHQRFDDLWSRYPDDKRRHAYHLLLQLVGVKALSEPDWNKALARYRDICRYVAEQVRVTREKDEKNPFRRMTYRNDAEMNAVLA